MSVIAYCVKCKEKQEMNQPEAVYTATGTPGTSGVCSVCGTKMFKVYLPVSLMAVSITAGGQNMPRFHQQYSYYREIPFYWGESEKIQPSYYNLV